MSHRLCIDIERLLEMEPHKRRQMGCPLDSGERANRLQGLLERVTFAIVCRHCDNAPCQASCPQDALERGEDLIVRRYRMRCIGCKSCVLACPFGTIFAEYMPYISSQCDLCLSRGKDITPGCVKGAAKDVVFWGNFGKEAEGDIFTMGKMIAVKTPLWNKQLQQRIMAEWGKVCGW